MTLAITTIPVTLTIFLAGPSSLPQDNVYANTDYHFMFSRDDGQPFFPGKYNLTVGNISKTTLEGSETYLWFRDIKFSSVGTYNTNILYNNNVNYVFTSFIVNVLPEQQYTQISYGFKFDSESLKNGKFYIGIFKFGRFCISCESDDRVIGTFTIKKLRLSGKFTLYKHTKKIIVDFDNKRLELDYSLKLSSYKSGEFTLLFPNLMNLVSGSQFVNFNFNYPFLYAIPIYDSDFYSSL